MHEIELAILTPRTSTLMEYKEEGSAFSTIQWPDYRNRKYYPDQQRS